METRERIKRAADELNKARQKVKQLVRETAIQSRQIRQDNREQSSRQGQ